MAASAAASVSSEHGSSLAASVSPENAVGTGPGEGEGEAEGEADADADGDAVGVGVGPASSSSMPAPSVTQNVSRVTSTFSAALAASASLRVGKQSSCSPVVLMRQNDSSLPPAPPASWEGLAPAEALGEVSASGGTVIARFASFAISVVGKHSTSAPESSTTHASTT